MKRSTIGRDIAERLLGLAVAVIHVAERHAGTATARHASSQLVRAVTSAGANYEEARHAESRADFVHKVGVAVKELAESLYWLRLLGRLDGSSSLDRLSNEADELIAILVASRATAKSRA